MDNSESKFILNDNDKFYNWVYPNYEESSYKIEKHPNEEFSEFYLSQGQKFVKDFLVDSPYRGLLLYHGLGTGKTCAALITAEEMTSSKHVLLFIPASLKQNWLNELEFCGNPIYKDKDELYKNYTFINYNSSNIKDVYTENGILNNFYLGSTISYEINSDIYEGIITKINSGIFNSKNYQPADITVTNLKTGNEDIINIDENNVKLVDNTNPFDNKIIIFDEVHNFIVTISNILKRFTKLSSIQKTKIKVYNHLKSAINCKIILLSGTPIVNNCYEISYISNILTGDNLLYKYEYIIHSNYNINIINIIKTEILTHIKYINYLNIEIDNSKMYIYFTLNPDYFYKINLTEVQKNKSLTSIIDEKLDKFEKDIEIILKTKNINYTFTNKSSQQISTTYMPENNEDFINKFLVSSFNSEDNMNYFVRIKNLDIMNSLLAGKISYLKGEIPTKSKLSTVHLPFGLEQENKYISVRKSEIESSKKQFKNDSPDDINLSSLRSKSRQLCNIYIPKDDLSLNDSFNSDLSDDDDDAESVFNKINDNKIISKFVKNTFTIKPDDLDSSILQLQNDINNSSSLDEEELLIKQNQLKKEKINIILEKIYKYSNKFSFIIDKLLKTKNNYFNDKEHHFPEGKVLIYSDFRESISGGVNFFDELLNIPELGFKYLFSLLDKELLDNIFVSTQEKKQYKDVYFSNELKQKLIDNYIEKLEQYPEFKNSIYYLWQTSNNKNQKENYIAHIIYDCEENKNGDLLRILFITRSGSEGISLKAVRQIHIIEPFWQETRKKQVIGRGIRFKSHNQLEISKHNVHVYEYLSVFNKNMDNSLLASDKNYTTDQYILSVSKKKQSIIDSFYNILKSVSLDCPYNSESIKCFSYNNISYNNLDKEPIYLHNPENLNIKQKNMAAHLIKYKNNYYIVHNDIIYDYQKYILHSILIKIGNINYDEDNNINLNITRSYSNFSTCYIPTNISLNIPKNIIDNDYYGDIKNNFTTVEFPIQGGTSQYNLIHNMENNNDDNNLDEYTENLDDFDLSEDDSNDILSKEKEIDNLYKNNEIDIEYNNIYLYIEGSKNLFTIGNYIALYDLLTQEKTLVGKINKITNNYILVNDSKIPILNQDDKNIILYIVKNKSTFIDEIGNELLYLYNTSDSISNLYNKYQKNTVLDYLISNILQKIKQYHRTNYTVESSQLSEEIIDKTLVQDIIKIMSDSEQSDSLEDLSSVNLDSLEISDKNESNIKNNSTHFKQINLLYINIINNYYKYYIDYLSTLNKSLFQNDSFTKINKFLINFIIKKDTSKINDLLNYIYILKFI